MLTITAQEDQYLIANTVVVNQERSQVANLRLINVSVIDSTNISAKFTETLNEEINASNISLSSQTPGVLDASVVSVSVSGDTLNIIVQPLIPQAAYYIIFTSSDQVLFNSLNGDAIILNDGVTNRQLIFGPIDSSNPVQEYLINFLRKNVYNLESPSIISDYIKGLSLILSKALYDIRQTKNENYLSSLVIDELKTRGPGAYDRLNEEGAYEVLRVGTTPTKSPVQLITNLPSFPAYPVSLQAENFSENLTTSFSNTVGTFNINNFTINLINDLLL